MIITAVIAQVRTLQGTSKSTGNDYDFDAVTALVDGLDPVEITVGADQRNAARLSRGQEVELEVAFQKGTRLDLLRVVPPVQAAKAG